MKTIILILTTLACAEAQAQTPPTSPWMMISHGFRIQTVKYSENQLNALNPLQTFAQYLDNSGFNPPPANQGMFRLYAKPGGSMRPTAFMPTDTYCCTLYRPWSGNYESPVVASFPLEVGGTITFVVSVMATAGSTVESEGDTGYNEDGTPVNSCGGDVATLRPQIVGVVNKRQGSYFIYDAWDLDSRWYSPDHVVIAGADGVVRPGIYTITAPITTLWTGVFADSAAGNINFTNAVANPDAIALGFGGGCYYSHGWRVTSGTVKVSILDATYTTPGGDMASFIR